MAFIDAHSHVWTDDTAHYPLAAGYKKADMDPRRFTPEDLFKHTRPAGVDRVNLIQMSYYRYDNPDMPAKAKIAAFNALRMADQMQWEGDHAEEIGKAKSGGSATAVSLLANIQALIREMIERGDMPDTHFAGR